MDQITVYGATWCPDCRRSKKFLNDNRVPFTWVDLESQPDAVAEVERRNNGARTIPTIVFPDGSHLAEPSNEQLADALRLVRRAKADRYDTIIVGGGPTGLTAAIYLAREQVHTLVLDRSALGGNAGVTERIDNYPGFPEGIGGAELAERFAEQARRYDVELLQAVGVANIKANGDDLHDGVVVETTSGDRYHAAAVLLATGSSYRRLGVPGEAELIGAGIHFCATCDGPFYRGADEVFVIGGGNSGLEEGLFLTQFAKKVTVVEFSETLAASKLLQDKVAVHPQMTVMANHQVTGFEAKEGNKLGAVTLRDRATGEETTHHPQGVFVFIGLDPNTGFLQGSLDTDARGFVTTDERFHTSLPGVFAAGDVRAGSTKQVATAVGEGAAVAIQIRYHLDRTR